MARSNRFTSGGGSSSSESSQEEQDSGSDYELSLPDDVKRDGSSSSSGGNSSNTVTPTRGSGSGGSSSSSGGRRRTTTGVDRTSRETTPDDSGGGDSTGGNSSNTVTPTRGSGSGGEEPAGSSSDTSSQQAESSGETRRQTTTGVDRTSRAASPRDATLNDSQKSRVREQSAQQIDAKTQTEVTTEDVRVFGSANNIDVRLTRDAQRKELKQRAAANDPLRDSGDFVVEHGSDGSPDLRKRAAPFFEEQRDALGLETPNESKIRRGLQKASAEYDKIVTAEDKTALEGVDPIDTTVEESGVDSPDAIAELDEFEENVTKGAETALNVPGNVLGGVGIAEQSANLVQADFETRSNLESPVDEDTAFAEESEQTAKALTDTGEAVVDTATSRPGLLVGGVAAGAATGIAAGRGIGRVSRVGRDRVRTAGATDITEDVTNPKTRQFFDESGPGGDRFPGAEDPEIYKQDPAAAVRKQAEDYTPSEVDEVYEAAGVEGGVTLKKALDVDPDGPGAAGFKTQTGDYESPGSFAGPEISPNFFGGISSPRQSLRPGLPSTGGKPTGTLVRTDVENPNARNLDEFNEELLAREGETTARAKPTSAVNTAEIEAVIPPDASFVNVAERSFTTRAARRLGIGAEFQVSYGGRQIPLRPVARESDVGAVDDALDAASGASSRRRGRSLEYYSDIGSQPVDRPTPVTPAPSSSPNATGDLSSSASAPDLDVTTSYRQADRDTSSGLDESSVESTSPSSSPSPSSSSGVPSSSPSPAPSSSGSPSPTSSSPGVSSRPSSPPGSPPSSPPGSPSSPASPPSSASPSPSPSPTPSTTTPVGLDPDLPDGDKRKKKDEDFATFERDIIAPVEEDPLGSIDESLKDL